MTTVENNTFTGPNTGISGGYVPSTTIASTKIDGDLNLVKDDLDYHLSILQAIYIKLDTVEINAVAAATASEIVLDINASAELIDANNLEATVALLSNIISDIEAHKITTTQSAMHPENSIKSTEQTYSYTPSNIVTSCQNVLDEINNVRIQIHRILGQSTWIDTPNINIASIKNKLDTVETNAKDDQTGAEIKTLYEGESNAYTNTKNTKLNGIETGADVTDATNVDAAGAAMNADKNITNGIAGLDSSGDISILQLPKLLEYYKINDTLLHSHDSTVSTNSLSWVKLKTITIHNLYPTSSTIRIYFEIWNTYSTDCFAQIRKNGTNIGTLRTNIAGNAQPYSEDLLFTINDTIEIWAYCSSVNDVFIKNFRIKGNVLDTFTYKEAVSIGDRGVEDAWNGTNS